MDTSDPTQGYVDGGSIFPPPVDGAAPGSSTQAPQQPQQQGPTQPPPPHQQPPPVHPPHVGNAQLPHQFQAQSPLISPDTCWADDVEQADESGDWFKPLLPNDSTSIMPRFARASF